MVNAVEVEQMIAGAFRRAREESPGSTGQGWSLTATGGDPRESATENKPHPYTGCKGETAG